MTILRRLASKVVNTVARLSSASAQDWARATVRELDFIHNDWDALFWALGSIRILFTSHHVPLAAYSQIPCASRRLRKKVQHRTFAGYAITLSEAACFTWSTVVTPNIMQKAGFALTVVAMLFLASQLFLRRPGAVPADCALNYRVELERQRDFHRGLWFWSRLLILIPGVALFCYAGIVAHPETDSPALPPVSPL